MEVSPDESSSQRLCTVFVPALMPQEAYDSEGRRGRSQSERDSGEENERLVGELTGVEIVVFPRILLIGEVGFGRKLLNRKRREIAIAESGLESDEEEGEGLKEERKALFVALPQRGGIIPCAASSRRRLVKGGEKGAKG